MANSAVAVRENVWEPLKLGLGSQVTVADPDLQIGGGGGAVIQTLRQEGSPVSQKNFFRLCGPHFGQKIMEGGGPPGPSPGYATGVPQIGEVACGIYVNWKDQFKMRDFMDRQVTLGWT